MSTVFPVRLFRTIAPHHIWPALLILIVQVGLYVWMAPRGFEFTDEAYYLHNFLHWRDFTGTVTFFGAYFELLFRAMGTSIAGMRIVSLLFVIVSTAILMWEVMRYAFDSDHKVINSRGANLNPLWYTVGPMASAMLFFGYLSTLRAPSYNLLSLAAIAIMTASMLRSLEQKKGGKDSSFNAFLYGLALGACFLSKATTSAFVVVAHLIFFRVINGRWEPVWLLRLVAFITAGFSVNLIVLTVLHPSWLASLREGMEIVRLRDGTYGIMRLFNGIRWDLQIVVPEIAPWLVSIGLGLFFMRKKIAVASANSLSLLTFMLVGAITFSIIVEHQGRSWLLIMVASTFALWAIEHLAGKDQQTSYDKRRELALTGLLFFLPVAFSFGTNMSVLGHSAIASLFAFCAVYLRLYRLVHRAMITGPMFAGCLVLLCIPALASQWLALTDVRFTYRQPTALAQQNMPVVLGTGASLVLVDSSTERSLRDMINMAQQARMPSGQEVLDLTGDGPGAIYAIGAFPLGSPWMLGGYPGSAAAVERVIQKVAVVRVRNAWLLTSTNNPRRMQDWRGMLTRRVGQASHELVDSIDIVNPHAARPNEPKTVNLQLWKPTKRLVLASVIGRNSFSPIQH